MTMLAIETSCDETCAAVLDGDRVLSSVTWSQIKYHRRWGGVVPSLARRAHTERLPLVVARALRLAHVHLPHETHKPHKSHSPVTAIAVTVGPGLAPALEAGIHYAKALALLHEIPLIPVNHLEGHIASVFLKRKTNLPYLPNLPNSPNFLSLIVSGGHTELTLSDWSGPSDPSLPSYPSHHLLGQTLDDAVGECLDKVGRELGLGYPAGPVIEKLAKRSDPSSVAGSDPFLKYKFPIPLRRSPHTDLNFSFSGLKTAAIQIIHGSHRIEKASRRKGSDPSSVAGSDPSTIYDFCASFQEAVIDALLLKLERAIQITGVTTVILTGGVAANNRLRRRAGILVRSLGGNFYPAPKQFTGDNAAMIGLAARWAAARGDLAKTPEEINLIDRQPNLNFPPLSLLSPPIDPSIKSAYESSPFDPLAQIRMTGRFLGKIVDFRGKMTPLIFTGSLILGLGFLLLGIFGNTPFSSILGSIILLNIFRYLKKFTSSKPKLL